jgi:hypothetical protein
MSAYDLQGDEEEKQEYIYSSLEYTKVHHFRTFMNDF